MKEGVQLQGPDSYYLFIIMLIAFVDKNELLGREQKIMHSEALPEASKQAQLLRFRCVLSWREETDADKTLVVA